MATVDSPQAFLCKFVEVFFGTDVSEKLWLLQNLSLTNSDSFSKNFDYHKLRWEIIIVLDFYCCLFSHKLHALIIVKKKCVATGNWKNALFLKKKNVLSTQIFRKMISATNQNTEFLNFSFEKHFKQDD